MGDRALSAPGEKYQQNLKRKMPDSPNTIELDRFLKWMGAVETGGEAKHAIRAGRVTVNGVVETRRGRKLQAGDRVTLDADTFAVEFETP